MVFVDDLPFALDVGATLALVLVASIVFAEVGQRHLHLPRVTGYAAGGVLFGPSVLGLIQRSDIAPYHAIIDVVVGLLVFELGSRVDLGWLRSNRGLLATSLVESLATFGAVVAVLHAFGIGAHAALMVGAVCIATSPAILVRIVHELRSRGQVTERALLLSALNAIYSIVLLKLLVVRDAVARGEWDLGTLLHPLYLVSGSFLLGLVAATAVAFILRAFSAREGDGFVLALSVLLLGGTAAVQCQLSAPLALLLGGILLRHRSMQLVLFPPHFGTAGSALVVILFVFSGVDLDLKALVAGGTAALAVVAVRVAVKVLVPAVLAPLSGLSMRKGLLVGMALAPMSGFTLMLGRTLPPAVPEMAAEVSALLLATVVVLELAGPIASAFAIRCARENVPQSEVSGRARVLQDV